MREKRVKKRVGRPKKDENLDGFPSSREKILAAAAEIFSEQGFDKASLDTIADRAGYSIGSIYHNFKGKADLLLEVVRNSLNYYHMPRTTGSEPPDLLDWAEFTRIYLEPGNAQLRRLASEIHTAAGRHPGAAPLLQRLAEDTTQDIAKSIEVSKAHGEVGPSQPSQHAAYLFMVVCVGLIQLDTTFPQLLGNKEWENYMVGALSHLLGIRPRE